MKTLKELIQGTATFVCYRSGYLVYNVDGFEFEIPVSDTGTGTFSAQMKSITLMRWIRKALEVRNG